MIDCPDLPLNVSRSALQNDGFVKKISDYITKKVADKLSGMYKVERENYEKFWDDISPFIKFGCLKDEKFRDKMKDFIIFKNLDNKYLTLKEYVEAAQPKAEEVTETEVVDEKKDDQSEEKEAKKTSVYYVTDPVQQSQYVNMFKQAGMDAVLLTHNIDNPFITQLEHTDDKIRFVRIDSDVSTNFTEESDEKELEAQKDNLTKLFRETLKNDKLDVKVLKMKNEKVSSMITLSEESRRMQDMMKMYNMFGMDPSAFGSSETLVLNANNDLVKYVLAIETGEKTPIICEQLYDLAMISHKPLSPEAMTKFVERSNEIMMLLTK